MASDLGLDEAISANAARIEEERRRKAEQGSQSAMLGIDRFIGEPLRKTFYPTDAESRLNTAQGAAETKAANLDLPRSSVLTPEMEAPLQSLIENERRANPLYATAPAPSATSRPSTPLPSRPPSATAAIAAPPTPPKSDFTMSGVSFPGAPQAPAPKPSSSIRYKTAGGEWKDYGGSANIGTPGDLESAYAGVGSAGGSPTTATYERLKEPGFTPSADPGKMPIGQRPQSWFEDREKTAKDEGLAAAIAMNEANVSKGKALTADPFADKRLENELLQALENRKSRNIMAQDKAKIGEQGASNLTERREFGQRWQEIEGQASAARAKAQATITDPAKLKAALAEIDAQHESDLTAMKTGFGVSERITSQSLYR